MFWQYSRTSCPRECFCDLHESCGSADNWHLRFSSHNNGYWERNTPPLRRRLNALVCPQHRKSPSFAGKTRRSSGWDARPMLATRTCQAVSCCARQFDMGATNSVVAVVEGGRPRVTRTGERLVGVFEVETMATRPRWATMTGTVSSPTTCQTSSSFRTASSCERTGQLPATTWLHHLVHHPSSQDWPHLLLVSTQALSEGAPPWVESSTCQPSSVRSFRRGWPPRGD